MKLLHLGHLLPILAYTKKFYVLSCWVSECFQVSSAFRQGPSKLIILLNFLIFFQVIYNYIETNTAHSPKIWLYNFKCSTQMSISYKYDILWRSGNSRAIDQWMHFVSLNLKQTKNSWIFQFDHLSFCCRFLGKK